MLSWIRKQAGSGWVKAVMIALALTFFGGFGVLSSTRVKSCLGAEDGQENGEALAIVAGKKILEREWRFESAWQERQTRARIQSQFGTDQEVPDFMIDRNKIELTAMDQMVKRAAVLEKAEKLGLKISDSELRDRIAMMFTGGNTAAFNPADYRRFLDYNLGVSEGFFQEWLRQQLLFDKYMSAITGAVDVVPEEVEDRYAFDKQEIKLAYMAIDPEKAAAGVLPGDSQVAAYYNSHKTDFYLGQTRKIEYVSWSYDEFEDKVSVTDQEIKDYYEQARDRYIEEPEQVNASHILIRADRNAPENDLAAARATIDKIREEAVAPGADFAELAKKYSEDGTKDNGGELGWFIRSKDREKFNKPAMVKEFEDAAFALKPGEISEPVQTEFGFHIIKLNEHKDAVYTPLKDVKDEIRETLIQTKSLALASEQADKLVAEVKDGKTLGEAAKDFGKSVETSKWFQASDEKVFGMEDSEAVKEAAFDLEMGKVSDPVTGDSHVYVIKVIEIKPERQGNLEEVTGRIQEQLGPQARIEAAWKKADETLSKLRAGDMDFDAVAEQYGATAMDTELMPRDQLYLTEVGYSDSVSAQVADMNKDNPWPQKPVAINGKIVLFKFLESSPADMSNFEEEKDSYKKNLVAKKKFEFSQQWLDDLVKGKVQYTKRWDDVKPKES